MEEYTFTIQADETSRRIDHYLRDRIPNISRTYIQKLLASGHITVNGCEVRGSYKPREGDEIEVVIPEVREFHLEAEEIPLNVVHEDNEIIVIDKPAGMVVHPAPGHWTGTLVNALLHHVKDFKGISGQTRPGLVHRLDMDTSGLLVVAKSDSSLSFLADEMKERRIKRKYIALTWGHMPESEGKIDAPIGRSRKDRRKMTVTDTNSRSAITKYKVLDKFLLAERLEISLMTGRTHQIRVHLSHVGHPVVGDPDYGGRDKALSGMFDQYRPRAKQALDQIKRQALHAYELSFVHPGTRRMVSYNSELPDDILAAFRILSESG